MKHFKEDEDASSAQEQPLKGYSLRYARKVERRHEVLAITPQQFLTDPALVDKDIWELRYASTSDEDDNDEEEESEYDSEDEEDEEEKKTETAATSATDATTEETKAASEESTPKLTSKPTNDLVPDMVKKVSRKHM